MLHHIKNHAGRLSAELMHATQPRVGPRASQGNMSGLELGWYDRSSCGSPTSGSMEAPAVLPRLPCVFVFTCTSFLWLSETPPPNLCALAAAAYAVKSFSGPDCNERGSELTSEHFSLFSSTRMMTESYTAAYLVACRPQVW